MERKDWVNKIILSSISLRQLNASGYPVGYACGCLIDYYGKRLILSVEHATGNNANWAIEMQSSDNIGTKLYYIGAMNFLQIGNIETLIIKNVDFSYAIVPSDLQPYFHELNEKKQIITQIPREILIIDFDLEPSTDKKYGFFGQSDFSPDNNFVISEPRLVTDMEFIGTQDDYYKFKLPFKHPGHDYFQGTSGAPIIDNDGNVVSLVCFGDEKEDLIYGVALKKYRAGIDIEVGNILK